MVEVVKDKESEELRDLILQSATTTRADVLQSFESLERHLQDVALEWVRNAKGLPANQTVEFRIVVTT